MENQIIVIAYSVYLPIALLVTLLVARVLFKNSIVFMMDIFKGREAIALATNKLFEVGFYLLNVGFALLLLKADSYNKNSVQELIELLSWKLGSFTIYLGVMLFFNLYLFFRGKQKSKGAGLIHPEAPALS